MAQVMQEANDTPTTWSESGYVHLKDFFSSVEQQAIVKSVDDITQWNDTPGKWMRYYEGTAANEKILCRIENFLPYHQVLNDIILKQSVWKKLAELMQEPALLFKEKINFKFPNGKGFLPHQDAPAFSSFKQDYHITILIPVDNFTPTNGCLQIVEHSNKGMLKTAPDGTIDNAIAESLNWQSFPCDLGDLVLFDSYMPHCSGDNLSNAPRRGIYLTFNKQSAGDHRDQYYALKRKHFPQDCERQPGVNYDAGVFNVANPIK